MEDLKFEGTKGKWRYDKDGVFTDLDITGNVICPSPVSVYQGLTYSQKNWESNAKLIVAAPDLLEALIKLKDMYVEMVNSGDCGNWNPLNDEEVINANKAIQKALK